MIKAEEMPGLSGAASETSKCVQAVAQTAAAEIAKKLRQETRWKSKVRIQIGEDI